MSDRTRVFSINGVERECVVLEEHPSRADLVLVRTTGPNPTRHWVPKNGGEATASKTTETAGADQASIGEDAAGDGTTSSEEGEGQAEQRSKTTTEDGGGQSDEVKAAPEGGVDGETKAPPAKKKAARKKKTSKRATKKKASKRKARASSK